MISGAPNVRMIGGIMKNTLSVRLVRAGAFSRRLALASAIVLGTASLVACAGSAAETPAAASAGATLAPVGQNSHGMVHVVGEALGQVPLRPDQRMQLEQLAQDAEQRHQAVGAARKELMEAIALQIESGSIDRAALQPKIDAAADAWDKARPADRAAFEKVHAILDADQRAKFIDALRATMRANHQKGGGHEHLKELAAGLNLTDAQISQIRDVMKDEFHKNGGRQSWAEHHERTAKIAEAFKSDRFVMDEVAPAVNARDKANEMSMKIINVAEKVLPILTAEQRTTAAQKLREKSTMLQERAPVGL
jgi:Spy/CpxP family protein refolding chaperone